jgi:signal transduction histidine kinase
MRTLIYPIALFIFGCLFGFIGYFITLQYELIPGMVSWYVPHGIKLVALFILPFRYWLIFLLGCNTGDNTYLYMVVDAAANSMVTLLQGAISFTLLEMVTGVVISKLARYFVKGSWFHLHSIMWLILLTLAYRLMYLSAAALLELGFYANIPSNVYIEYFIAQQLSGYLVGFYFFTCHLLWLWHSQCDDTRHRTSQKNVIFVVSVLALWIALFIPLILMAARFGWYGVMLTSIVVKTSLLVFLWQAEGALLIEYQPYMLSYSLVALLIGAVLYEKDNAQYALEKQNSSLERMTERLQVLGRNILNNQERERQYLSQELHDEVGQNIIALKTTIRMLEVNNLHPQKAIDTLKVRADDIYSSVYHLMHWLRPVVLDDFGLYNTLGGTYFREKLDSVGIVYQVDRLEELALSALMETAIFRIVQEAITNTIKHSNATTFRLSLFQEGHSVRLILKDDGDKQHLSSASNTGKFGLEGIHVRVAALNGFCIISDSDGFLIDVQLPYEMR